MTLPRQPSATRSAVTKYAWSSAGAGGMVCNVTVAEGEETRPFLRTDATAYS
jgi:hypothetical protein